MREKLTREYSSSTEMVVVAENGSGPLSLFTSVALADAAVLLVKIPQKRKSSRKVRACHVSLECSRKRFLCFTIHLWNQFPNCCIQDF